MVLMDLDMLDKAILALAQGDMDICDQPFDEWARTLDIQVEELVDRLVALKEKGVIREIKAVLRHTRAGFIANAMVVWAVSEERVDEVGVGIASHKAVSHCYERHGFGPYTVYSMIHARTKDDIMTSVRSISDMTGINDYQIFWSVKELKKSSMKYFSQEDPRDE